MASFDELLNSTREVDWEEILSRYDNHEIGSNDPFEGCVADFYEVTMINPAWRTVKDLGNDQLKQGKQELALELYSEAACMTENRFMWRDVIMMSIQREKESKTFITVPIKHTLLSEILSIPGLATLIGNYTQPVLPQARTIRYGEKVMTFQEPNRPAAICYGNRAAVLMKQGKFDAALMEARKATSLCPEYLKAHERIAKCLTELGDTEAANKKKKELHDYKLIRPIFPHYTMHLITAGWISWDVASVINRIRFAVICRWMKSLQSRDETEIRGLTMICSLVPYHEGQCLNCTFTYEEEWERKDINSVIYGVLDPENGNDLELPPHGHASAKSKLYGPRFIAKELRLALERGLIIESVILGQGLIDMVPEVQAEIQRSVPANLKPQPIAVESTFATQHGPTFGEIF
mmetsp:Transcript_32994/g.55581  ORF Transcript_32994/g.55581 Transcript_32994/m.55581 type:complete len:407 (-) Transcript_32994:50-1270(-)